MVFFIALPQIHVLVQMQDYLGDLTLVNFLILALMALIAGFLDAVVGGGGLIQLPAFLITMPQTPTLTIFGTNKIAALSGTSFAAWNYSKKITFNFKLLATTGILTAISAILGAKTVSSLPIHLLKPLILFILIGIAIYTYLKKDLGGSQTKQLTAIRQYQFGALLGIGIGFYDGFFGPGTGSFLVLGFVTLLGFDFLHASAYAKVINCIANIGALTVYIQNGQFLIVPALLIAIFNITGNITGSKMAIAKGNIFIRKVFLVIVILMIARYAYDILKHSL